MKSLLCLIALSFSLFALDLNKATLDELTTLKGIGAVKAKSIIAYREANKCIKSLDDLLNIKGIGESFLTKNKNEISLSPCK
ncbi:MAG: ComEA family DNA-binding protein [Candidatus Marinarcus sp.]|uniref:ComEA family DNA-binding protein n=1 Tax=Candidatus Marinarcus sp. TaxID=3100987 RepID=UPI003B00DB7B